MRRLHEVNATRVLFLLFFMEGILGLSCDFVQQDLRRVQFFLPLKPGCLNKQKFLTFPPVSMTRECCVVYVHVLDVSSRHVQACGSEPLV